MVQFNTHVLVSVQPQQKSFAPFPPLFSENKILEQNWMLIVVKYMRSYLQRNSQGA